MCGIVATVGSRCTERLTAMNALLRHRGPDDDGEFRDPATAVGLAMRRLSILDLEAGHQPMSNEDDSIWIVFNGEIYNSPDLRPPLVAAGHPFKTSHSDTEVLLHLYEDKQEKMLDELNGMFAFVIFDRRRRRLFAARDRVGKKPLYYTAGPAGFAAASELKCLLALPHVERRLNEQSLFHYMSLLYVPGEESIFQGIRRLPPGHWLSYDLGSSAVTIEKYWDLDLITKEQCSEEVWVERIREGLRESVRRRMLSDVPIGCSLSGGLDSAAIVGLLNENGAGRVKTYSIGFEGPEEEAWNELPRAREVAQRWGTEHHELVLQPQRLLDDLVRMVWHLDEPYGGGLPSWYVFEFMSESVKVGLTGTGGDEAFGSYGKFRNVEESALARRLCRSPRAYTALGSLAANGGSLLRHIVAGLPGSALPATTRRRWMDKLDFSDGPCGRYFFRPWYYLSDAVKRQVVVQAQSRESTVDLLERLLEATSGASSRDAWAYLDYKTQLPDEFLMMTDRFSMAHSLEARAPFVDHTFIELVFRIPDSVRTDPRDLKRLLKKAVADLIPPSLLNAPKSGFRIPTTLWLRGALRPLAERLLAPARLQKQGVLRPEFYGEFVRPHLNGEADFTNQVWAALMYQLWHVVFIEERRTEAPAFSVTEIAS